MIKLGKENKMVKKIIKNLLIAISAVMARTLEILPCNVCKNENPITAVKPEYGSNTPIKAAIKNRVSEIPGIPCMEFVLTPIYAPNINEKIGISAQIIGFIL
jgi:hypothetical protein